MLTLSRRAFVRQTVGLAAWPALGRLARAAESAAGFRFDPQSPLIQSPRDPADWPAFRRQLTDWRQVEGRRLNHSDALYRRDEFAWASSCFCCCFVMLSDQTFYDPRRGRYQLASFLGRGRLQFGGYDAVVLWHAYPRIGADDRNQFDFYRDMPGGILGLRDLVRECHRQDVRVFIDYNPWDTGTRREPRTDLDALALLVQALEADGIFLDTMSEGAAEFRAKLDAARGGVVLESEGALPLERLRDHHLSWAQWFDDSETPGVLRNKWLERRHLQHQIKRWNRDHSGELHTAWMNGSGMLVWENVFGSWVGWNARDRSTLRAMLPIQRRYASLFRGEGWTPLVPTLAPGVYASAWEGEGLRLWTLVNRTEEWVNGPLLRVPLGVGELVSDLMRGSPASVEALVPRDPSTQPEPASGNAGSRPPGRTAVVRGRIPPRGIGCLLAGERVALGGTLHRFLQGQAALDRRTDGGAMFPELRTRLRPASRTRRLREPPREMAEVPAAAFEREVVFTSRECGFYGSSPPDQTGWDRLHQPVSFRRAARVGRFAMDLTPVTNGRFAEFLRATAYRPRHPENFLKHWGHGRPPAGQEDHPVVYVDLGDARAYARWAGRRLPTEEEWQYAAQGPAALRYPWGNEFLAGRCNDGAPGSTTAVRRFPEGRSPFGIYDLCGNVWEWTESERSDGRTRFCLLKGGSFYKARGSVWYFDGGPQVNAFAAKFLLLWPGLDRCATIGFRCVVDLA